MPQEMTDPAAGSAAPSLTEEQESVLGKEFGLDLVSSASSEKDRPTNEETGPPPAPKPPEPAPQPEPGPKPPAPEPGPRPRPGSEG